MTQLNSDGSKQQHSRVTTGNRIRDLLPSQSPNRQGAPPVSLDPLIANYFHEALFEDDAQGESLMGPIPSGGPSKSEKPPAGLPAYMMSVWSTSLLNADQEMHGFRKLNFLKHLASQSSLTQSGCDLLDDYEGLYDGIRRTRDLLIESNLRLVISLAKKYAKPGGEDFEELVCVGNAALVRAVDLFDYRRGLRFSTYAYQAIQRSIFDMMRREKRQRSVALSDSAEATQVLGSVAFAADPSLDAREDVDHVLRLIETLDERDKQIVKERFGLNRKGVGIAFHVIAKKIGLSTTRTVQLFNRSLRKLQSLASERQASSRDSD